MLQASVSFISIRVLFHSIWEENQVAKIGVCGGGMRVCACVSVCTRAHVCVRAYVFVCVSVCMCMQVHSAFHKIFISQNTSQYISFFIGFLSSSIFSPQNYGPL